MKPDLSPSALRKIVLEMAFHGKTVHIPCAFSMVEIVSSLYSKFLRYDAKNPRWEDRDYLVLSKGHGVMALYAAFHQLGWIGRAEVEGYFSDGSALHGLSEAHIPGLEVTSGSLGHGLPIAVGLALGFKLRAEKEGKKSRRVFCIVGDGEMNEGSMWEALLFAGHHELDNLCVVVDANGFQAMGRIGEILDMEPFVDKFTAFGFDATECDGHSLEALDREFSRQSAKPRAIVARTVKGKGVSFMEHDNTWHYTRLDQDKFDRALAEVEKAGSQGGSSRAR
jgi:transketolase